MRLKTEEVERSFIEFSRVMFRKKLRQRLVKALELAGITLSDTTEEMSPIHFDVAKITLTADFKNVPLDYEDSPDFRSDVLMVISKTS